MHDLDRTQLELEWEADPYIGEYEDEYDYGEYEYEDDPEMYEDEYEFEYEYGSVMSPAEEMEFAAELLEVMDEEELEQFLGKVFKWAKKKYKKFVPRSIRRVVSRKLRGLARKALPWAGRAVGAYFGGPIGASIGGKAASMAGRYFGLELEGLSPEDQEFEIARRFVRLTAEAARQASQAPANASPQLVAQKAVAKAVKKHAPGLTATAGLSAKGAGGRSGTWKRRGNVIMLFGA